MIRRLWAFLLAALLALLSLAAPVRADSTRTVEAVNHTAFTLPHAKDTYLPWKQAQAPPLQLAGINLDGNIRDLQGISIFTNPRAQLNTLLTSLGSTVADYQPGNYTGTLNASAWLNSIGAAPSLDQASGAAQPIILPFSGQKYAYISGVAGNNFTSPSSSAANVTGDIDLRAYVALNSWLPATYQVLIDKYQTAGQRGYQLYINVTSGAIGMASTGDGSTIRATTSTVATGFTNGTAHWVRATRASATGNTNFYTSEDGVTWTLLGAPNQTTPAGGIFAGTSVLTAGAQGTASTVNGKIYRSQIYNGINGTLSVDFNAADWPETTTNGATAVSSTTGETWTLNNTGTLLAQIVGSPQLVGGGTSKYMQMTATIPPPYFVIAVIKPITWTSANVLFDGKTSNSFAAQQITGTPQVKMYDGTNLTGAINPALNTYAIITAGQDAAGNATIQRNNGTAATGTLNATALGGFTLFGNGAGTKFGNAQVKEVILLNAIPSSAKLAQIQNLLNQIYHIYAPYASANDWLNELPTVAANDETYRLAANGR